jgi:hypothetical protein
MSAVKLTLSDKALVVFVDDTGHEVLVKGHPVYGLGGCATMAPDLDRIIRGPWLEIRRLITGSRDVPLHASDFSQGAKQEHIEAIAAFFRTQPFARLGAIISFKTTLADELGPVPTIALVLQQRIIHIAKWTTFQELHVIFESSDRANPLIEKAFQGFNLQESGKPLPVECYFMKKAEAEPGLEVADSGTGDSSARAGMGGPLVAHSKCQRKFVDAAPLRTRRFFSFAYALSSSSGAIQSVRVCGSMAMRPRSKSV